MGIKGLFPFLRERYPCITEEAIGNHNEVDNFYLDVCNIIFMCLYSDISMNEYVNLVFDYVNKLVHLVKPKKLLYLSLDGPGPSAKLQMRRFRWYRGLYDKENTTEPQNEEREAVADFLLISEQLKRFIKYKMSRDSLWQKCNIILNGYKSPGEAEIKIMDYIRFLKCQPDYNPQTRHCLYGRDNDLIILGLCTHESNFVVLREDSGFFEELSGQFDDNDFIFVHLGLLREYLEMEFTELKAHVQDIDMSKVVDEFVFMTILLGNDYTPSFTCMPPRALSLLLIFRAYIDLYPELGGNINENGTLNLERLEKFFKTLANIEYDYYIKNLNDSKTPQPCTEEGAASIPHEADDDLEVLPDSEDIAPTEVCEVIQTSSEDQLKNFELYKEEFYKNQLNFANSEQKEEQIYSYIKSLQWILDYYYKGLQSWNWKFTYNYPPFITDLKKIKHFVIKFELGEPLPPYAQAMSIFYANVILKDLPKAYHELVTDPNSELRPYFPDYFGDDLTWKEGIQHGLLLIPFIDEEILLNAMQRCESQLTPEEKSRNCNGPIQQYKYTTISQGQLTEDECLPELKEVFCEETEIWPKTFHVDSESVPPRNYNLNTTIPSFKHLIYKWELRKNSVQVLKSICWNDSTIVLPQKREHPEDDLDMLAEKYLNKVVYVGWPFLTKARVVRVSTNKQTITQEGKKHIHSQTFQYQLEDVTAHLGLRMGIHISQCEVLLHVQFYRGRILTICSNTGEVLAEDCWSSTTRPYPLDTIVWEEAVAPKNTEVALKVEQIYTPSSLFIYFGSPYFGSQGRIIDSMTFYVTGRIKVNISVRPEPNVSAARQLQVSLDNEYLNAAEAAKVVGISTPCLFTITGSIIVFPGAKRIKKKKEKMEVLNIGLKLRFPKKFKQRAQFCRRVNRMWFFSKKAVAILQEYKERFASVLDYIDDHIDSKIFFAADLFEENADGEVLKIVHWIKMQDIHLEACLPYDSQIIADETYELLKASNPSEHEEENTIELEVEPHLLIKPNFTHPSIYKYNFPISLFDSVVIVKKIPRARIGASGIITAIYPLCDERPIHFDRAKEYALYYDIYIPKMNGTVCKVPEEAILVIKTEDSNSKRMTKWRASEKNDTPNNYNWRTNRKDTRNNESKAENGNAEASTSKPRSSQRNQGILKRQQESSTPGRGPRNTNKNQNQNQRPLLSWRTNEPITKLNNS